MRGRGRPIVLHPPFLGNGSLDGAADFVVGNGGGNFEWQDEIEPAYKTNCNYLF